MPTNNYAENKQLLYAGIDEVLAKPPSRIAQYGSGILLFILVVLFSIAFFVRYSDGLNERVILQSVNSKMIFSGTDTVTVQKIAVQNGSQVKKGDTLVLLSDQKNTIVLTAPVAGILRQQRLLAKGDILSPATALFLVDNQSGGYKVSISVEQKNVPKIAIGQSVKITLDKFPKEKYGQLTATIASLPYETTAGNYVADASLSADLLFFDNKMPPIQKESGTAFIITGNKRLFARFISF